MEPVIQQEISGCGIAATAALARVDYDEARRVARDLGIRAEDPALWSDTVHVRRLLSAFHLKAAPVEVPFDSWRTLPRRALLAIKWRIERGSPCWHWVVFVRRGDDAFVLDSKKGLKRNIRRDFGRMKPRWYIEIRD